MVSIKSTLLALGSLSLAAAQYGPPAGGGSGSASTTSAAAAATARAVNGVIDVQVGNGGLIFTPNTVMASAGDKINFHYYTGNHSIAESTFASPCSFMQGGIWSGFMPVSSGIGSSMFTVAVNDTNPHWLYCSQTELTHCQAGMVMVINPPANSPNTLAAYKSAASSAGSSTSGTTIEGGVILANVAQASSTASATQAASSSSAAPDCSRGNWVIVGAALALSGVWAALMA